MLNQVRALQPLVRQARDSPKSDKASESSLGSWKEIRLRRVRMMDCGSRVRRFR